MKLIKLDAIDSTNDFLKALAINQDLENFTVVTAQSQTKGRGQMGTIWTTEKGKNLIMSLFVKDFLPTIAQVFDLNILISVSIIQALESLNIPKLNIKWPNDILSGSYKIGGILIENSIKHTGSIYSIVGLGLNVNQIQFENLPKASSIAVVCNQEFDKEMILEQIIEKIKINIQSFNKNKDSLQDLYTNLLFKKNIPTAFKNLNTHQNFMGVIQGVTPNGKLRLLLENDTIETFEIKEIQMLY
ncbi:MAG: BirA family transcriptional regulator [Bacteroidota bacterium]|nr:BirA family transcriptional regulator [Bacteroidota bacterium]